MKFFNRTVKINMLPVMVGAILLTGVSCRKPDKYNHLLFGENSTPEGTKIEAYQGADARTATVVNEAYDFSKTTTNDVENYTLIFKDIVEHEDKVVSGTIAPDVTKNDNTVLEAKNYTATIPLLVKNQRNEALVGASITHDFGNETTNGEGKAVIIDDDMTTDLYNQLQATEQETTH